MYNLDYIFNETSMTNFKKDYHNPKVFLELCKKCKNFNNLWSCPPYNFNINNLIDKYSNVYLIATKINFSNRTIDKIPHDKIKDFTYKTLADVRKEIGVGLLDIEKKHSDSISLYAGSCLICKECTRPQNIPCRYPDKMRYSLESLGFDVSKIANDLLNTPILWSSNKLPEYFTLVSAVFTNNVIDNIKEFFK